MAADTALFPSDTTRQGARMNRKLTDQGRRILDEIAGRHGVGGDAVLALVEALISGGGTQAQFNHPDLGGMGQWSQGGMTMVGDMFNNALKYRVDALCSELAALLRSDPGLMATSSQSQNQSGGTSGDARSVSLFVGGAAGSGNWWPQDLGIPSSTGAQNNLRYAMFPAVRRLAIDVNGAVTVYDTGDHLISGFSQQQGGDQTLTFTSQFGLVRVSDLPTVTPVLEGAGHRTEAPPHAADPEADRAPQDFSADAPPAAIGTAPGFPATLVPGANESSAGARSAPDIAGDAIFTNIKRLAELHDAGILTDEEFQTKKTELLSRL